MNVDDGLEKRIRDALGASGDAAVAGNPSRHRSSAPSRLRWVASLAVVTAVVLVGYLGLTWVAPGQVETSATGSTALVEPAPADSDADPAAAEDQTGATVDDFTGRSDGSSPGGSGGSVTELAGSLFHESMVAGFVDGRSFDPLVGQPLRADVVAELDLPSVLGVTTASCVEYCRSEFDRIVESVTGIGASAGVMTLEGDDEASPFGASARDGLFIFVGADGSVVGRDWFEVDAFDMSRLTWLADIAATVGSASVGEIAVPVEPSSSVVVVDQSGAVLSLPIDGGALALLIEANDRIERAWSIGDSETLALSWCCEPASGTVLLADPGSTPDRATASGGFDAIGLAVSSDGNWIATGSSNPGIYPATSPFDSERVHAGTPSHPPRAFSWVAGELKLYLLRTSPSWLRRIPPGTFIEVVGFDDGARSVVKRSLWEVSPDTIDVAVDGAGNLLTLVASDQKSTIERRSGETGEVEESIEVDETLQSVASDPSGALLAGLTKAGVLIYDTETLLPIASMDSVNLRSVEW